MFRSIRATSGLRPEVAKSKELLVLSKKPMNQLTDDELSRLYSVNMVYISSQEEQTPCDSCDLCQKRKSQKAG